MHQITPRGNISFYSSSRRNTLKSRHFQTRRRRRRNPAPIDRLIDSLERMVGDATRRGKTTVNDAGGCARGGRLDAMMRGARWMDGSMDRTLDRTDTTDGGRWRRISTDENDHLRFNRARVGEFTKNDGGKVAKVSREHSQKRRRWRRGDKEEGLCGRTCDARVLCFRRDWVVVVANHSNGVCGGSDVNGGGYAFFCLT